MGRGGERLRARLEQQGFEELLGPRASCSYSAEDPPWQRLAVSAAGEASGSFVT